MDAFQAVGGGLLVVVNASALEAMAAVDRIPMLAVVVVAVQGADEYWGPGLHKLCAQLSPNKDSNKVVLFTDREYTGHTNCTS
jgi:hypothetical protein